MEAMRNAIVKFVQSQQWAVKESYLPLIEAVLYAKYFGSPEFRKEQLEKFHAEYRTQQYSNAEPWVRDGVAVVPVVGVLGKRMNMVGDISTRGVSTDVLRRTLDGVLNDSSINGIVLDMHTPGGTISGTPEVSDFIYNNRGKKPIIAHANDMMASAGYYIGSAADKVFASPTSDVGSIGVYMLHYDFSKANEIEGIVPTYVSAGKHKTLGNPDSPLTEEAMAILANDVNAYYKMFVDAVARNRGISAEQVMIDARSLMPNEAIQRGLVDEVMTLDEAIQRAKDMAMANKQMQRMITVGAKADSLISKYAPAPMAFTHNSQTDPNEPDWGSVDKTKLPHPAFAEQGDPNKKSTWGYPHHWVKGGTKLDTNGCWIDGIMYLHRGGLSAAVAASNGARSGQQASQSVKDHLQSHRKALGITN